MFDYSLQMLSSKGSSDNVETQTISRKGLNEGRNMFNKTIKPSLGYYLAGFADGEGSFNVSFRKRSDYELPWKVSLCFNISQREKPILALFKKHLACGTMRQRKDGVWYYEVNNFTAIIQNVIPFFKRFHFLSQKKKRDFSKFILIAEMMHKENAHLSKEGIERILQIRKDMNDGGKRKYTDDEIMREFE